jgi:hypothetical protein
VNFMKSVAEPHEETPGTQVGGSDYNDD